MIENDFATLLATNAALTSVPVRQATQPQSIPLPKITIEQIQERRIYSNSGDANAPTRWYQVTAIAATMAQAKAIGDAITTTIGNPANYLGKTIGTSPGTRFGSFFVENRRDMAEPVEAGKESVNQLSILSIKVSFYQ